MRRLSWLWPLLLPALSAAAEPVTVFYIEKPPYYHSEQGEPTGFLLERTRAIFSKAGVGVHFEARPAKRIQMEFQLGREPACSVGWFKTAQRSRYAWFSRAIHRDAPMVVLTRNTLREQIKAYASLTALLSSPLRLGLIDGFPMANWTPCSPAPAAATSPPHPPRACACWRPSVSTTP
ncbi:hypothetical protein I0E98_10210 [Pseudomonas lalucatii]|nr:hypothetical protein [Pseudomonas lalucatii]